MEPKTGVCKIHGELNEQNADVCITNRVKRGWRLRCKACSVISKAKMYEKNREKHIQQACDWAKENRPRINERKRKDRAENPEKHQAWEAGKYRKGIERHGDDYRIKQVLRKHNLSRELYDEMVKEQNNLCAICSKPETQMRTRTAGEFKGVKVVAGLAIDHCHTTGKIRALLCRKCNLGLGAYDDNVERMQLAIDYLNKHKQD